MLAGGTPVLRLQADDRDQVGDRFEPLGHCGAGRPVSASHVRIVSDPAGVYKAPARTTHRR